MQTLALVEQAGRARAAGDAFLPLRLHLFHRAQPGFWACVDPACPGRTGTPLDHPDWRYGAVFAHETERCHACDAPTFEIAACSECGALVLMAEEDENGNLRTWQSSENVDEFAQDVDPPEADDTEAEQEARPAARLARRLIVDPMHPDTTRGWLDRKEARLLDTPSAEAIVVGLAADCECPGCGCRQEGLKGDLFRVARMGAPFLLGNAVPQLLEAAAPRGGHEPLPFDGRQLITFTDSRQGTARFAAKLQQDAERNFVRSAIYHAVQSAAQGGNANKIAELEQQISALKPVLATSQQIRDMYEKARREVEALKADVPTLTWSELQQALARLPDLERWSCDLWSRYDSDFADVSTVANFQLFREFMRRPKRQNSTETMGLASLRFDAIDNLKESSVPAPFVERGLGIADWREFLYVMVTHFMRNRSAVALDRRLAHWIGRRVFSKRIKKPGEPAIAQRGEIAWPWATRETHTSLIIRLLAAGLNLDLADPAQRDRINECFEAAYYDRVT